jgi:hypothetical protein
MGINFNRKGYSGFKCLHQARIRNSIIGYEFIYNYNRKGLKILIYIQHGGD